MKKSAFTIIELIVVMAIIVALLLMAVPAFKTIHKRGQLGTSFLLIQSNLERARIESRSWHNTFAVRVSPLEWVQEPQPQSKNKQILSTYIWTCSTNKKTYNATDYSDNNPTINPVSSINFAEHFELRKGNQQFTPYVLPLNIGVAPIEAETNSQLLSGQIGFFSSDPENPLLIKSEDFIFMFNNGVLCGNPYKREIAPGYNFIRDPYPIWSYNPTTQRESYVKRYPTTGFIIYDREALMTAGINNVNGSTRQFLLNKFGIKYIVNPQNGKCEASPIN